MREYAVVMIPLAIFAALGAAVVVLCQPVPAPKLYVCTETQRGHCVAYKEYENDQE